MATSSFWNEFLRNALRWSMAMRSGQQRMVFHSIDELLQSHGLPFCFDLTIDDADCLLILSPEGDTGVAEMIDKLVAAAPKTQAWRILGRRPRKPLADAAAIVRSLYRLDPLQARFRTYESGGNHLVEMVVPASADLTSDEGLGMINTFLWHAFGEEFVMNHGIQGKVRWDDTPPFPTVSAEELFAIVRPHGSGRGTVKVRESLS